MNVDVKITKKCRLTDDNIENLSERLEPAKIW